MAFEEKEIDPRGFLFVMLLALPRIAATNIDCNGRPFHCVNSTHFMICVDLGGGLSSTIDDFILPCPEPTICHTNNRFECEFPPVNPSTQLGSLHATNATAIESGITTESTLTTVSTTWDATLSEATINTLSPTTSNAFRNATIIDMINSSIDPNNTTVLSEETTTEMFTLGITNTPTFNDILNITNTIVTESKTTPIFINDTDIIPSTISTDLWTESIMSTHAPTASTDNLVTSNSNTSEHIISTDLNMTSALPIEMTTDILIETTNSINTTDLSILTTNDEWTKPVTATVSPTSGNDLFTSNTIETVLTIDPNATTASAPEITTETTIKGIESTLVPTFNDVPIATIATANDPMLTTDAVKTTDLPLSTPHDTWTKPIITTLRPTISGKKISISNNTTVDVIVTTYSNVTSVMPQEVTTEILNEEIVSTIATTTNDVLNTTVTTPNVFNVTKVVVNTTDFTLMIPYDGWTNPVIATIKPISGNDFSTSNTVESVMITDPNITSSFAPEATTKTSNKGIENTLDSTSSDVPNATITTVSELKLTTDAVKTADLSLTTTHDAWPKVLTSTLNSTTSADYLFTASTNLVEEVVTTDLNVTTLLASEITPGTSIKIVGDTIVPTFNDGSNLTSSSVNNPKLASESVNVINSLLITTNETWTKPLISTPSLSTNSGNLSTLNTKTIQSAVITDLNVNSALVSEITTDTSIKGISSSFDFTSSDVTNATSPTLNNIKVTTASFHVADISPKTSNATQINSILNTLNSTITSDDLPISTITTGKPLITTDSNVTSILSQEATTAISIKEIAFTDISTFNDLVTTTIAYEQKLTTDETIASFLPSTITNLVGMTLTNPTVSLTTTNDSLRIPIIDIVGKPITTDSDISSVLPLKIPTEFSTIEILSTAGPTFNDIPNMTDATINNNNVATDSLNTAGLPLTTINVSRTKPIISPYHTGRLITSSKYLHSLDKKIDVPVETTDSYTISILPPQISMPPATEILLSIENKTTNTFTVNATKSLFTVKPEAVRPTYRESQANPIEENSSTVSVHDSDNRDFVTTTSTHVEAFKLKNEESIPKESYNQKKLPIINTLKQYNTETEFHKSTVDPGTITKILGITTTTQYINSIEKRSDSTDKLPIPYLSHTSPENNKVTATTITDFGNFNKSNLRDRSILINASTSTFLVTTDNPHIKLSTKHEEPTMIRLLNMTANNSSHINTYNEKSALNIYDSIDSGVTLRGNNRGNPNVPIHSKTENNGKKTRNANDTTAPAINWKSTPNINSYGNVNTMNFDCAYHKRGRYAENNDCRKFYICIGRRQPIIGTCPINTVFSEIWKQCTKNLSHCVRNNQFRCISEGRFSDVLQHNVYYICIKSDADSFYRFKLQCQNGYYLNKTITKCIPNADEASQSLSVDTDSSSKTSDTQSSTTVTDESEKSKKLEFECTEGGVYADPNDCRRYYLCTKNKSQYRRKKKKCDSEEVFHKEKKKCVDADSYEC
ncbi:hypothetical protein K1T71_005184 [Dendrolimus kikuchii]|uniref:Uncharacterized protein n=1 Tax=Dendrolimus kikuchii TaxID=765133 RepID=A0ACC1D7F2_9NEOP|nr:hypothetical protein K1T71_005184 [Dendrolimus kikuchii]